MSTLKTNTLSNVAGTASTAIENAIHGSAKAWVNFNGTGTVAIRASYNVSSITDNGTGDYTVNFTTAFADANYAATVTTKNTSNSDSSCVSDAADGYSTSYVKVLSINTTGVFADTTAMAVAIFR
jgi:hypothetical protein